LGDLAQQCFVYFGVVGGALDAAVPKDGANGVERSALS
jgi:hypothetical protein